MQVQSFFHKYIKACLPYRDMLFDLLLPKECLGCGSEGNYACHDCWSHLRGRVNLRRIYLDAHEYLDGAYALARFDEPLLQRVIKAYKYNFVVELSGLLAGLLVSEAGGAVAFQRANLVVPVPLHPRRLRWRGFNQSALLAKAFAEYFRIDFCEAIERHRYLGPQAKLQQADRLSNISGCFAVQADVSGRVVWLIDDVATTGATLDECARVLKQAGAQKVLALALAHG